MWQVVSIVRAWATRPLERLAALTFGVLACVGGSVCAAPPTMPAVLRPLIGCWRGEGIALGKPITIRIKGQQILLGSMLALDVSSTAKADPADRYDAHLLFGADAGSKAPDAVSAFWADSFGGAATTTGRGSGTNDGLEIRYRYPNADFLNRWQFDSARLRWTIVVREANARDKPFARYALSRESCWASDH